MGYATVGSEDEYLAILRDLFAAIYASPEMPAFATRS